MLFRVLTDIRYPFFTTIRPDIRRIVRFLSRNNKKKWRDKTLIKLVIDDKKFNFINFTNIDLQYKKTLFFFDWIFSIFSDDFFFSKKSTIRRITDNGYPLSVFQNDQLSVIRRIAKNHYPAQP